MKDLLFSLTALLLVASLLLAASPALIRETRQAPLADPAETAEEPPSLPLPLLRSAADHPSTVLTAYDLLFRPDPKVESAPRSEEIPEGCFPIVTKNLSPSDSLIYLSNETAFHPDTAQLAERALSIPASLSRTEPLVLILHTHATEAYAEEGATFVSPGQSFYSSDPEQSVIAVGAELCASLNALGIPAIHCTARHDAKSGGDSYTQAKKTIRSYLTSYPTLRYILDLHRDCIVTSDGVHYRPLALIGGEPVAQIMFVMGTNEAGAAHPAWEDNLALACRLQKRLSSLAPSLTRPVNLRRASFNEQYTPGSMLIEIGSEVNSLPEAKRAADWLAIGLAEVIREIS